MVSVIVAAVPRGTSAAVSSQLTFRRYGGMVTRSTFFLQPTRRKVRTQGHCPSSTALAHRAAPYCRGRCDSSRVCSCVLRYGGEKDERRDGAYAHAASSQKERSRL
jgi:hypothetical protein